MAVQAATPGNFTHFIDLQGKIDALNIAYVTPRNGTGGQVKAIYVKKGDQVKKGQLLLKLDDALLLQQLAQANNNWLLLRIYMREEKISGLIRSERRWS